MPKLCGHQHRNETSIDMNVLSEIRKVLGIQSEALEQVSARLNDTVADAVDLLHACQGKVVVIGMGKCGHIGRKIAATFASTGTPATFLHPAEALHGDLGYVTESDAALILSNSGQTQEVVALVPYLKRLNIKIIALTGKPDSTLGRQSDVIIDTCVEQEGGPLNLAPMASTTVMLAVGDALAAVLMHCANFNQEEYAMRHPGGRLGQKLLCVVSDLMLTGADVPLVDEVATLLDVIHELTSKRLGAVFVKDGSGKLSGVLTDGDIRRLMEKGPVRYDCPCAEVMTRGPRQIPQDMLAIDALKHMEDGSRITVLAVVDAVGRPVGALHIHDLIQAGIA